MSEEQELDFGTAGASARREGERRRLRREAKARAARPRLGKVLLKFEEPPQHERSWETGATGEEALAASLARRCPEVLVLHDRAMPGSRANVDHIAIASAGVYVIDAKRLKGQIEVRKPFFGEEKLVVAGRDKTKLVESLERQVDAVRSGLELIEQSVPVSGCFCFINPQGQAGGSGIPVRRRLQVKDFPLLHPKRLAKRLNEPGSVGAEQRRLLAEALIELFPAA